ncbi:MAG: amino acid-binding protein [Gammaproteobacteria bacterium]|nr:MAG: amino acid-binding protein [Gammaproteobacteria bacterium]
MSDKWWMLTLIGRDSPGIVAAVTRALAKAGITLGETSMLRLGGNFTVMMMVSGDTDEERLGSLLAPVVEQRGLRLHIDPIEAELHQHLVPNVQVTVSGPDRTGMVAQVTSALAEGGFNILDLESDVAGTPREPLYIIQISGIAVEPVERIEERLAAIRDTGISVNVVPVDTYIG